LINYYIDNYGRLNPFFIKCNRLKKQRAEQKIIA